MRAAARTLFGSYCRDDSRGRWLIVLALQAIVVSEISKESEGQCFSLRGRYGAQDPHPVGNGQAPRPRKWVFFLRGFAKLYASLRLP